MRVLYPIHIDRWTNPIASLLREIAVRNNDMQFYTFSDPVTQEDRARGDLFWSLPHIHRIRRSDIVTRRFDIVHVASATTANLTATLGAQLRSGLRCRHVFTANIQTHPQDLYLKQYLLHLRLAQVVVAVSKAVAMDLQQLGRSPDAIIPNGFDPCFFDPDLANPQTLKKYGISTPYFLFAAVLKRRKRPDVFLDIAFRIPNLSFVMVGGFYTNKEAQQYLTEVDKLRNVRYLGKVPREELRDLMGFASALVFPSEIEGLPLTVVEASGMGLPVLAQPRSSLPEVVEHGLNGWLLPVDRLDQWASLLEEVVGWDRSTREAFRKSARKWAIEKYSWDVVAEAYGKLYRQAVNSGDS